MPFGPLEALAALTFATAGAAVYSTAGFGLGLIAAAPLLLIHGSFVPGPLMAASLVLRVLVAHRNRAHIDFTGMTFALLGRVAGTVAAAGFFIFASPSLFEIVFAVLLLMAVVLSAAGFHVHPNRLSALLAGGLSGLMGTIASIGGPPMALLYQRSGSARLRGTLAGYSTLGTIISLVALAAIGRYGSQEILLSLFLLPAMILGFLATIPVRGLVSDAAMRPIVLGLSLFSAMIVLWRVLV